MFQGEEEADERTLSIEALGLPTDTAYVGYDFWEKEFIQPFEDERAFSLRPTSCKVISLHPVLDRPQVVSTSRHITQGAVELEDLAWDPSSRTLAGTSELVADDPYEIRLHVPSGYRLRDVQASDGASAEIGQTGEFSTVTVSSPESKTVNWRIQF
ncbi:MAG: hypothetical protein ACOC4K_04120 [Verrucomicrobiota bacterium]